MSVLVHNAGASLAAYRLDISMYHRVHSVMEIVYSIR